MGFVENFMLAGLLLEFPRLLLLPSRESSSSSRTRMR